MNQTTTPLLRAGTAKSDITTDDPSIAVHDRMYAKVLALDDGTTTLVIVSMDAVAIGGICDVKDDFVAKLRARIESELGIPPHHVMIHATHTHPPGKLLCDDAEQVSRTFDAVKRATANQELVRVGWGKGHEDRIAINRVLRMKNGGQWTIRHTNPCPPDGDVKELGPLDADIGILRVDRVDGTPLAVLYNYACHPLVGVPGGKVTANFPGFASTVIEETLGHGVMAIYLQGAAGDVTETLWKDVSRPMDSEPIGMRLGVSTLKAHAQINAAGGAKLMAFSKTVKFPRRNDSDERIRRKLDEQNELLKTLRFTSLNIKSFVPLYVKYALSPEYPLDYSYRYLHDESIGREDWREMDVVNRRNIDKYLANCRVMEKLAKIQDEIATFQRHKAINAESGESTIDAEIQGFRIGDCVLLAAPVEVLTEVGLNVKKGSPFEHTWVIGFTNGYMHYGPPAADYDKESYEVTECLLGPQWQEIYESTAAAVLDELR